MIRLSSRLLAGRRAAFTAGVLCGIVALVAGRVAINRTPVADWLVAPLLMADTPGAADAIVVPGAGVITACVPNGNAVRRVLHAARLWRDRRAPLVVFTGGTGTATCTVADAMARLAVETGVPEANVRVETVSRSTHENGQLSAPLLRGWGARRLLVVTDQLHMRRASGVFLRLGFEVGRASVPIYEGHPDNVSMLRAGLREAAAITYYRARGWLGDMPAAEPATTPSQVHTPGTMTLMPRANPSGPIVVLGASYAQGWAIDRIGDVPVVNRGVSGQQSFEMLARFESDVIDQRPRAVVIWGFINDVFRAPAGGIDEVLARTYDSYVRMVAQAREHGIEPVLATEVTARPTHNTLLEVVVGWAATAMGRAAYQDGVNVHVLALNARLAELARREGLVLLDFQRVLAEDSGARRRKVFAQPDGSHITEAGYRTLSAYATPILQDRLAKGAR